jgi:hypothetical protein
MTKIIDRKFFWSNLTRPVRPLNQSQVDNISKILDHYDQNNYEISLGGLASYLGQCEHESAHTYAPIRERGGRNYFRYLIHKLGIDTMDEAWMFRGWGRIQTTGETNFITAVKLINKHYGYQVFASAHRLGEWLLDPTHDKGLESDYDLIVGFTCCTKGLYTGKKFNDYIKSDGTYDLFNSRRVVNGLDQAMTLAQTSKVFYNALQLIDAETVMTPYYKIDVG